MKNKYIVGGGIIVIFTAIMAFLFTQTNVAYESDFEAIKMHTKSIKATGAWVKNKGYDINKDKGTFSFYMTDNSGVELKVVYRGAIPNNFESATSVVVTGKYKNGFFIATDILTKCPSKYEEQFDGETASNI